MAKYYVLLTNFSSVEPSLIKRMEEILNKCKDWLRFNQEGWLVYTDLSQSDLRERVKKEFAKEDPSILIVNANLDGWAAYAKPSPREWLKRERSSDKPGE